MIPSAEIKKRFATKYMEDLLARDDPNYVPEQKSCDERIANCWDKFLGPSYSPQQTFKMLEKKYGAKVAAKYKPKIAKKEVPAKATSPANGKNGTKDMV